MSNLRGLSAEGLPSRLQLCRTTDGLTGGDPHTDVQTCPHLPNNQSCQWRAQADKKQ